MRRLAGAAFCALSLTSLACGAEEKDPVMPPGNVNIGAPTKISDGDRALAIDPTSTKVAYTSSGALAVRDLTARATIEVGDRIVSGFAPVFDNAWTRVAYVRASSGTDRYALGAFDLATKGVHVELTPDGRSLPELTSDGTHFIYLSQETGSFPSLMAWNLANKTERTLAERATSFVISSGSTIVYSSPNPSDELRMIDYLTGDDRAIAPVLRIATVSDDKKFLMFFSAPGELQLLNMLSGEATVLATDATETGVNTAFSGDGSTLIFSREEITGRALYRSSTAAPSPSRIFAYTEDARISRDGSKVLLWTWHSSANLFLWTASDQQMVSRTFWPSAGGLYFDDSMRVLVYSASLSAPGADGELHIYDTEEEADATLPDPASPDAVYVANDGSRVAFFSGGTANFASLRVWERATNQMTTIAASARRELVAAPDLSAIFYSTDAAKETLSVWLKGQPAGALIARTGGLQSVKFTPNGQRYVFMKGVDLYADLIADAAPAKRIAQDVFGPTVLTETLVAYAVTKTSTAGGGVYIAPLP